MTAPLFLLDALEQRLKEVFSTLRFPDETGTELNIHTFQMALPSPEQAEIIARENEEEPPSLEDYQPLGDGGYTTAQVKRIFPCAVIRPLCCEIGDRAKDEEDRLTVVITVGVFENGADNAEGGKTVVMLLEKIRADLEARPVLESRYECDVPSSWELMDSETRPYWFGEIMTTWTLKKAGLVSVCDETFGGFYR